MAQLPTLAGTKRANNRALVGQPVHMPIEGGLAGAEKAFDVIAAVSEEMAEQDARREAQNMLNEARRFYRMKLHGDGTEENPGFLNLKGEQAVRARARVGEELKTFRETMAGKATTQMAADLFGAQLEVQHESSLRQFASHTAAQRLQATDDTYATTIAELIDDAAADPRIAAENAAEVKRLTIARERLKGMSAESAESIGQAAATQVHMNEIQRLAIKSPESARAYFLKHEGDIDGRKHNEIEALITGGETFGKAMNAADKVTGDTLGDRLDSLRKQNLSPDVHKAAEARVKDEFAIEEADRKRAVDQSARRLADASIERGESLAAATANAANIEDTDVRAQYTAYIKDHYNTQEAIRRDTVRQAGEEAAALAMQGQFDQIPAETIAQLPGAKVAALQGISAARNRGAARLSDPVLYNELNRMDEATFAKVDLTDTKYLKGLSETDWRAFSAKQGAIMRSDDPTQKTAMRTRTQIVRGIAEVAGFNDKQEHLFATRLDEHIAWWEQANGKKADAITIQQIGDRLAIDGEVKTAKGSFSAIDDLTPFSPDARGFEVKRGEVFFIDGVDDIPANDRADFETLLTDRLKRPPTDEELINSYNKFIGEFIQRGR